MEWCKEILALVKLKSTVLNLFQLSRDEKIRQMS
jgi:hypothetical protein